MASRERRPKSWLKKRGDVYWVRFQYPPALQESACDLNGVDKRRKDRARSLGVTTLVEAEAKAEPFIADHKELSLYHTARNDAVNHWANMRPVWLKEPGREVLAATQIVATELEINTIAPDGSISTEPSRKRPKMDYTEWAQTQPQFQVASRLAAP
jgi:hypothetical protein